MCCIWYACKNISALFVKLARFTVNFSQPNPLGLYPLHLPLIKPARVEDTKSNVCLRGKDTGEIKTEPLTEKLAKDYIGGIGMGIKLLMDNSKPGTDAYDPDNPLIYMTGPLSGTMGPTGGNSYAVVSKSPATGCIGNAEAHGFFGPDF